MRRYLYPLLLCVNVKKSTISSEQLQLNLAPAQELIFHAWKTDDAETILNMLMRTHSIAAYLRSPLRLKSAISKQRCMQRLLRLAKIFKHSQDILGKPLKSAHIVI
jgi:hypothetical protein